MDLINFWVRFAGSGFVVRSDQAACQSRVLRDRAAFVSLSFFQDMEDLRREAARRAASQRRQGLLLSTGLVAQLVRARA